MTKEFLGQTVELSLKVAELVDLIEAGAVAENSTGYQWPIVPELRELFAQLATELNAAAEEV
jgi:hypothetical protein